MHQPGVGSVADRRARAVNRPLWDKTGVELDARAMRYMAGEDVVRDRELFAHDVRATRAHVIGLGLCGLLTDADRDALVAGLDELGALHERGEFVLDERYEDGHSAIESWLTERLGQVGARVHLGRSRNDQVLVALRLYMRESLEFVARSLVECGRACLDMAREHETVLMPGYSHIQRAVPSTAGLWLGSFAEELSDDAALCVAVKRWLDRSPLGAVAGYGVNLPLARERVARELGFGSIVVNPLTAQASRGKIEAQVVSALWQGMQTIRRLAWDLSLYSSAEFGFVSLPGFAVTGSSIMPNKRNPDLAELMRTAAATVGGAWCELVQTMSLPSGYHRDLQSTKAPLVRAVRVARDSCELIPSLVRGLTLHADRMEAAMEPGMLATDAAVKTAASGLTFRDAYRRVGDRLGELASGDYRASVESRVSPGACGDLRLDEIEVRLNGVLGAGG